MLQIKSCSSFLTARARTIITVKIRPYFSLEDAALRSASSTNHSNHSNNSNNDNKDDNNNNIYSKPYRETLLPSSMVKSTRQLSIGALINNHRLMVFKALVTNNCFKSRRCYSTEDDEEIWEDAHRKAIELNMQFYSDPKTGYKVFTKAFHEKRGRCCGNACRHCPYGWANVRQKTTAIQKPAYLFHSQINFFEKNHNPKTVFFWSGGKNSFLALRKLIKLNGAGILDDLILLTTFSAETKLVPFQNIAIEEIVEQAKFLNLKLLGVPLHKQCNRSYTEAVQDAFKVIGPIKEICFGDLEYGEIQKWRENTFKDFLEKSSFQSISSSTTSATTATIATEVQKKKNAPFVYPLVENEHVIDRQRILDLMEECQVPFKITYFNSDLPLRIGQIFDHSTCNMLKDLKRGAEFDIFGRNGELHTLAEVWRAKNRFIALGIPEVSEKEKESKLRRKRSP